MRATCSHVALEHGRGHGEGNEGEGGHVWPRWPYLAMVAARSTFHFPHWWYHSTQVPVCAPRCRLAAGLPWLILRIERS